MVVYVSGPYRGNVEKNIAQARKIAIDLWEAGHTVICPHLNTAHFENDCNLSEDEYLFRDMNLIARCDAIVLTPDWDTSEGAKKEYAYAVSLGLPVYVYPDIPPLHPTEVKYPMQSHRFAEIAMQLYRLHLKKNADYSSANILLTGEVGLVTRLWDKISRLLNLIGFHLEVKEPGKIGQPKEAANEAIEDTYIDCAVYAIIGILLREEVWGR